MDIFHNISEWQNVRKNLCSELKLGFIPTMGNLHPGHSSLMSRSLDENDLTLASIFVNPTQFDRCEDLNNYPRTLEADLDLLHSLGVQFCLLPQKEDIYRDNYRFQLQENQLCRIMEGQYRPAHFTGVLTVMMKLLHIAKPHRAYFGEKDYQQYLLIRDMADAFFIDTDIIACPTLREDSGLARSSRNHLLNEEQKRKAAVFARLFQQQKSSGQIKDDLKNADIHVEYLEEHFDRRFIAVFIDKIRLIDNYRL